ncbi:hypothetical protein LO772_12705 [Yinghuangia sp. ASG 101]|uniref:DUF2231 domain-containing protein n=1 Tax=Yinghuangia sp. ASG 101 TaxID=2896848 RepID=UPI001E46C173|nr:DUF2231 domain-containing protein [Yinghuangia sp. ASG 101]UGQ14365.1 hypothetical protein LO772_12705 [Yinghuangia sp. ASG 101]
MFDTSLGLPTHILILHAAVIGVPLAALATVAVAVRPGWLPRWGWWVVGLDGVILLVVVITRQSGEEFLNRVFPDPESRSDDLKTHIERGDDMLWYAIALFVVAVVLVLVARQQRRGATAGKPLPAFAVPTVAVLAVAAAVLATIQVVLVGHSGSSAVWKEVVKSTDAQSAPR